MTATGRVYWSEITTLYLTTIKSANPDGTAAVTVTNSVLNQRGLLVDPIRRKLFWVGSDAWQRQELIYRSELDGSNPEVVYGAPEGMQIRALTLDPYNQKLYWLDPTGGAARSTGPTPTATAWRNWPPISAATPAASSCAPMRTRSTTSAAITWCRQSWTAATRLCWPT
jgi:hypothetical protein